ncbi:hypothetical protein BCR15_08605 [Tessaracoccus lapidicaptus]|jgi:hypothetical protein|uniref:Uncharacterized protein n=1 Tax=Tessaracoccus lapidicaptus TaxID=1427523 RepID=A0A1C0AHZ0_9ACTN|nr:MULTISPECIES: DUF6504 family protein [Tessaracoccus]AQX16701.1 hypothetical protein BKM78_12875 [Tessaracoccus sp. T2.5-30]OCL31680.1 hypothetical protein BCR15_08605 [Tessaracoccus lapidicaptus]VEP41449.1 hypothetical protein TLA_TLA_02591 [Tessaracoccus lapidicaptus]
MRTYDEPIHVLFRDEPRQFIWRGRLLLVKEIQGRWSRATPWWTGPRVRAARGEEVAPRGDLLGEREVWRVEAGNGRQRGVYELARTVDAEDWVLRAVFD